MRQLTSLRLIIVTAAVWACGGPANQAPPTRLSLVVDTMHGIAVEDPYRWLEDQQSPEVREWILRQGAHADSVMGPATPLREQLRARFTALMDVPSASAPRKAGAFEYFTLRKAGEPTASIYRRPAAKEPTLVDVDGSYEKVVDATAIQPDGSTSVGIIGFTEAGDRMLYSVRDGGPDEISVFVRDLRTMQNVADSLPWALYGSVEFAPDGQGLYYVHRSRTDGPRFKYHRLGSDPATDSILFGEGLAPTSFLNVSTAERGRYRVFTIGHGWARNEVKVQDTRNGVVHDITTGLTAHFSPQFIDGSLWMRTDLDAPRGRLIKVDLVRPEPEHWVTIVPEGDGVLDAFSRIDGKLYITWIQDVAHRITVHGMDGARLSELEVPPHRAASIRGAGPGFAYLTLTGFEQPSVTWRVDLRTNARTIWEPSRVPFDTAAVEVSQVWYTSKDGTRAPMYLMQRRGAARSADTPVLMTGYGGFTLSLLPRFDVRAAAWVERGGIFALATLRGGNEFGESWHKDGMLLNKQHVFDDFTAAGQYLVDSGYTSPAHFAIRGVSNAGLLMGAALTQRPDLYRAAFVGLPDLDLVRFPAFTTHNNMPALLEYGDATRAEEFEVIRKFSPYQNIKQGTRYPAVLVQTGMNDTRVPPWQARKFAARLQAATSSGEPVIHYHDFRSGHAGGRSTADGIDMAVKEMEFLWSRVSPTRETNASGS